MTAVVVDTNVLASGFVAQQHSTPPAQVLDAWRARVYTLVVSEHILGELADTFEEPYFRKRLTPQEAAENIALLRARATITPITVQVHGVATHPEDDLVLATAVSAKADYLITGDAKLQRLTTYEGITIVSPLDFLEVLTKLER